MEEKLQLTGDSSKLQTELAGKESELRVAAERLIQVRPALLRVCVLSAQYTVYGEYFALKNIFLNVMDLVQAFNHLGSCTCTLGLCFINCFDLNSLFCIFVKAHKCPSQNNPIIH